MNCQNISNLNCTFFFYCRNKNVVSIFGTNWLASFECPNNLDVSSLSRQQLYSTYHITMLLIFCSITYNCTLHLFPNKETFMETDLIIYCRVYRSLSTTVFELLVFYFVIFEKSQIKFQLIDTILKFLLCVYDICYIIDYQSNFQEHISLLV